MQATLFKASGEQVEVTPANGTSFDLQELQAFVGGTIEIYTLPCGKRYMVMNDEGALLDLPVNAAATVEAYHLDSGAHGIRGDVLVCPISMID